MSTIYKHELVVYTAHKEYYEPSGVLRDQSAYVDVWHRNTILPADMSWSVRSHFDIPKPDQSYQSAFSWDSLPAWNRPKYQIGETISRYSPKHKSDYRYYAEQALRRHKRHGARAIYEFLQGATEIQITIVGVEPYSSQATFGVANQCYLETGQSHSGLSWYYKVLVTGLYQEKRLAAIPDVWIQESALER